MTPTGITELSIGLGAAAIIVDKVLNWTVKWKRTNGNGKVAPCTKTPEWALHNQATMDIKGCMSEIVKTQQTQTLILQHLSDIHDQRG